MEILSQILSVCLVFGLLAFALWWLRRNGVARFAFGVGKQAAGRIESIEQMRLSPQHTLHLVRVADRAHVIILHPAGASVVETRPWSEYDSKSRI